MDKIPVYGNNIGIFVQPDGVNTHPTNIERGITSLPVGALIHLTQGGVMRVISPFKVLVTGFSGKTMNIVYGVSNANGQYYQEGTVEF